MGFLRQEYWSGLPFPPPSGIPNPEIKPESSVSLALQVDSLPAELSKNPWPWYHFVLKMLIFISYKEYFEDRAIW